jgi:hypothetical protein
MTDSSLATPEAAAPAGPVPGYRVRRALAAVLMLVAFALGLPRFLTHTPYPRFGVVLDWASGGDRLAIAEIVGPPGQGVFKKGDRLLAYQGEPLTRDVLRERFGRQDWPRDAFTLQIKRDGRVMEVVVPPLRLTPWQRVRIYTLPLAAVVAVPIVAFLLVWRRPDLPTAWVFLWFASLQGLSAIFNLFRHPQTELSAGFRLYLGFYHAVTYLYPAAFLHFMTVFPRRAGAGAGRGPACGSGWWPSPTPPAPRCSRSRACSAFRQSPCSCGTGPPCSRSASSRCSSATRARRARAGARAGASARSRWWWARRCWWPRSSTCSRR